MQFKHRQKFVAERRKKKTNFTPLSRGCQQLRTRQQQRITIKVQFLLLKHLVCVICTIRHTDGQLITGGAHNQYHMARGCGNKYTHVDRTDSGPELSGLLQSGNLL